MYQDELLVKYLLHNARVEPLQIVSGVYFLFEGEEIVYIGQSTDVFLRVRRHWKDPEKPFDKWAYIEVSEGELLETERKYIDMFQPYLNKSGIKYFGDRKRRNNRRPHFIVHKSGLYESIPSTEDDQKRATETLDRIMRGLG